MAQFFGVTKDSTPALFIINPMNEMARFKYPGSVEEL
jgi:hypothetical protein